MKYTRFEETPAWQAAITLAARAFAMADSTAGRTPLREAGDLRSQLLRAAVSVSNNIAEGFERGTTSDLIWFLYIARGSAGEVRSMACLMERLPRFAELKSDIVELKRLAESCGRQLRGWADALQNSEIKGQRHLNDATREELSRKAGREEFLKRLDELRPRFDHPPPPPTA